MKTQALLLIIAAAILTACGSLHSETQSSPPQVKDMLGAWIGCAWGATEFYRLELLSNGTGSLVILNPKPKGDLYLIERWTMDKGKLTATVKPEGRAESIAVEWLYVQRRYMEIQIRGVTREWMRNVTLYNEKDWEERMQQSRDLSPRARGKTAKKSEP
jgi:hypothetical protein